MRFSAPQAPKIFGDLKIIKNTPPPLVNDDLETRGGIFIKNCSDRDKSQTRYEARFPVQELSF